ncbi:MAG: hypothetical protein QOJ39_1600 [Candidatus Eremiobacteraeota bacterium]|nr:hypothetical protein [Candidatus Eremiobacteraeota bacterium]
MPMRKSSAPKSSARRKVALKMSRAVVERLSSDAAASSDTTDTSPGVVLRRATANLDDLKRSVDTSESR